MSTAKLKTLHAYEVLDSRGNPTVGVELTLGDGTQVVAEVPSGASTGTHEAVELRDNEPTRFNGKGVQQACGSVNNVLLPLLKGKDVTDQRAMDQILLAADGTANKSKLGANALLAVSMACARAAAAAQHIQLYQHLRAQFMPTLQGYVLPTPMMNFINGGKHADSGLDFQEYMVVPHAPLFRDRVRMASEIYMHLGSTLRKNKLSSLVGDEGGFAPHLGTNTQPLDMLVAAIRDAGYAPGQDAHIALDVAASEFFDASKQQYYLSLEKTILGSEGMIERIQTLCDRYPILSVEDALAEDDWSGWRSLTQRLGASTILVGDDLFVTNVERIQQGISEHVANAVLIKPNQIGTVTETMQAIQLAYDNQYTPVISHRSGETEDTFIADLAVAVNAPYIKAGAVARGERSAKYNRLIAIELECA